MKLNIGCGEDYKEGYVNIDLSRDIKADLYVNDENEIFKRGFKDVEEILIFKALPYIDNPVDFLCKCHKILKSGGKIKIIVPHFCSLPYSMYAKRHVGYRALEFKRFGIKGRAKWGIVPKEVVFNVKIKIRFYKPFSIFERIINSNVKGQELYETTLLRSVFIPRRMEVEMIKI